MRYITEIFVAYDLGEDTALKTITKFSCKRFNIEGVKALKRKLREDYQYNYPLSKYRNIEHTFNNGSKLYILLIKKNLTSYELNEALLDAFKDAYQYKNISYNIQTLDKTDEIRCAKSLTALEETLNFKIPRYGKKRERNNQDGKITSGFYTTIKSDNLNKIVRDNLILGRMNNLVRELCYLPPNKLDSEKYIKKIRDLVSERKDIEIEVYDLDKLEEMGANLFRAVAQANMLQGCGIVKLKYKPASKKKLKKICLIGKGVVYDSGGLDLKTDGALEGMHRDMTGSAVALGSFLSQVEMGAKAEITCYLPIVENSISRDAYRTGDIIETINGISVEIVNTDAEGRLVLADSILIAKQDKPDIIIDYATLTGTAIDALGGRMAAGFTNKKQLRHLFEKAGENSGERVWGFPILSDIQRSIIDCEQADIYQSINSEDCDHIVGAAFLQYFVEDTPHIHIDLSCEYSKNGLGLIDTEVTGFGVFFTHEFIRLYTS
jgi:leucyl aminopeptidase